MRIVAIVLAIAGCGASHDSRCHGLELADCRLDSGCRVDACEECSCTPVYRGCLATDEVPVDCPALGCMSPDCCSEETNCQGGTSCAPPGTPFACGSCTTDPSTCATDADCKARGASMICEPIACSCDDNTACTAGCVDDSTCDDGTRCDVASSRCVAIACVVAADCPGDFDCADGACTRRSCTTDLDCDGYCVLGACYAGRGVCEPPSA